MKLTLPVNGTITQNFGENYADYSRWGYPGHNGIDYACPIGTQVYTACAGKVYRVAYENGGYGKYIVVDHGLGYFTYYAHLSSVQVNAGKVLKEGACIALSGSTGNSTGPHLHFGLKGPGGSAAYKGYINPAPFFGVTPVIELPATDVLMRMQVKDFADGLRVRSGPGLQYHVKRQLTPGDKLNVYAVNGVAWVNIGTDEWVAWIYDNTVYLEEVK